MDAAVLCRDTVPHKVAAPAACAHLLLRAAELNRFHLAVCWQAGLAVPGSGFSLASWASPEMSFVLQHYPFTKPRLLEIYTSCSNDSLKMNAQKTVPLHSCLSHVTREDFCFGSFGSPTLKGEEVPATFPTVIYFTVIILDIFVRMCVY